MLNWTKNYQVRGLQNKDVVQTLREAIDRTGVGYTFPNTKLYINYYYLTVGNQTLLLLNYSNITLDVEIILKKY